MAYQVLVKKHAEKSLSKLPENVRQLLFLLVTDLQTEGPIQRRWPHFSSLGDDRYHCHLTYRYVACWAHRKGEIVIEVYYVGSREKAPY
jgi:mRNA-degrading endonuclease RelE of RelBE toxin-antitoxin system